MKKTDYRVIKKRDKKEPTSPIVYYRDDATVPPEYPQPPKPCDRPNRPHPRPEPEPEPQPSVYGVVYGDGLTVDGNTVSVNVCRDSSKHMTVDRHGLSIKSIIDRLDKHNREIAEMASIIVDLKSQINKLTGGVKPSAILNNIVNNSDIFEIDENDELTIKLGNGLATVDGKVIIDHNETLIMDNSGKVGVDFDDTLELNDNKLGASGVWGEFETSVG